MALLPKRKLKNSLPSTNFGFGALYSFFLEISNHQNSMLSQLQHPSKYNKSPELVKQLQAVFKSKLRKQSRA